MRYIYIYIYKLHIYICVYSSLQYGAYYQEEWFLVLEWVLALRIGLENLDPRTPAMLEKFKAGGMDFC